ncbi:MAG: hypothetical protein FJY21_03935 [Bacteroidetes bacterium]|nr:hypothetical protein [Bacteroidota bacterium]
MQKLDLDSDKVIEHGSAQFSDSIHGSFAINNSDTKGIIQSDLNLFIMSDSGKPINRAFISIDLAGITVVCDKFGKVSIRAIQVGTYQLDIISPGYIAKAIFISIFDSKTQEMRVQLSSNIG